MCVAFPLHTACEAKQHHQKYMYKRTFAPCAHMHAMRSTNVHVMIHLIPLFLHILFQRSSDAKSVLCMPIFNKEQEAIGQSSILSLFQMHYY